MERQVNNYIDTSPLNHVLPQTGKRSNTRARTQFEWNTYRVVLIFTDLTCLLTAFICAYWLRFTIHLPFFYENQILSKPLYDNVMLVVIPVWITIFALMGLYSKNKLLGGTQEYAALFNATTLGMFLIITARFTFPTSIILARGWVILAWLLSFTLTALCRFGLRRYVYYLRRHGAFRSRTLIVGANEEGRLLAQQFLNAPTCSYQLVGFVEGNECGHTADEGGNPVPLTCLGTLDEIEKIIRTQNITHVILSSSALTQEQILKLFVQFGTSPEVELLMSSGLYEIITTSMHVREDGSVPLIMINKVRLSRADQIMKSLLDLAITLPILILGSPFFLLLGLLVKLDSAGPIIYRRRVMGVNGKQFDAFKIRTMNVRSEEILQSNPELMREYLENFKIKKDPRVTRIGKFLRKASLDELPQLINVVRGEMSLVGPRMITPQELSKYNQWGINLLTVKPGLTGLWQVRGRSEISYDERVRMDMYYIRNWSLWFDIQLLVQTIPAVLSKRGAF